MEATKEKHQVGIEVTVDVKHVLRTYLRSTEDIVTFLEIIHDVISGEANPSGARDATAHSARCYKAMHLLDDLLDEV